MCKEFLSENIMEKDGIPSYLIEDLNNYLSKTEKNRAIWYCLWNKLADSIDRAEITKKITIEEAWNYRKTYLGVDSLVNEELFPDYLKNEISNYKKNMLKESEYGFYWCNLYTAITSARYAYEITDYQGKFLCSKYLGI